MQSGSQGGENFSPVSVCVCLCARVCVGPCICVYVYRIFCVQNICIYIFCMSHLPMQSSLEYKVHSTINITPEGKHVNDMFINFKPIPVVTFAQPPNRGECSSKQSQKIVFILRGCVFSVWRVLGVAPLFQDAKLS